MLIPDFNTKARRHEGEENIKEALFYKQLEGDKVQCTLCPWNCHIAPDKVGFCGVRKNIGGKLYSLIYGHPSSVAVDPIEKKPLFHFHPGTKVFSMGTWGCNMRCGHCQNWQISRATADLANSDYVSPEQAIGMAKEYDCQGIAWTYNEPTIWFEYTLDCAKLAKQAGLYTVYVTNGYISFEALDTIAPFLDAYRVDVKGFTEELYLKLTKVRDFKPVLAAAERALKKWKMHVEVVTNIIPTLNDDDVQLSGIAKWIAEKLGQDIPWHVTRFFPHLEYKHLPPTDIEVMEHAKQIGHAAGLKYVYVGNVPGHPASHA
ncbi:MAG: AmmeMemoRadiSam system radical SAM enzyme [Candidatus Margulisbacteria bacterium]|nr:AmmeMemoRadiSam system radical SAM enzyme [Candidatus Margulisiibacteriota bacterium]